MVHVDTLTTVSENYYRNAWINSIFKCTWNMCESCVNYLAWNSIKILFEKSLKLLYVKMDWNLCIKMYEGKWNYKNVWIREVKLFETVWIREMEVYETVWRWKYIKVRIREVKVYKNIWIGEVKCMKLYESRMVKCVNQRSKRMWKCIKMYDIVSGISTWMCMKHLN